MYLVTLKYAYNHLYVWYMQTVLYNTDVDGLSAH